LNFDLFIFLQSIFGEFEHYVREKKIKWGNFCGDNGQKWEFLIASTDRPFKTTSIGSRWSEFPAKFGFEAGVIITFKFGSPSPFHVVHIYKVSIYVCNELMNF
jgi:hypothetical protein